MDKKLSYMGNAFASLFASAALFLACSSACANDGKAVSPSKTDDGRPFGVCSHPFAPREINIREPLFDKMREAGVQWLRTDFVWGIIERKKGEYNFKIYDEIVDALAARNIKVLGIITGGRHKQFYINKEDRQDWLNYIAATVEHFKGRVSHWEIINEHDIGKLNDREFAAEYGRALKAACQTIRKTNPDATILYGGLAGVDKGYIETTLKECPTGNFDVMNFHSYPAPRPPEPLLENRIKTMEEAMDNCGGRKPIWTTEIGATTPNQVSGVNLIRAALEKFGGIKDKKIAGITDGIIDSCAQAKFLFPEAEKIKKIPYSKISKLDENYILLLPASQNFPTEYLQDLANFIKVGGTAIHTGGYPLYYDEGGKARGNAGINMFGANIKPHWGYSPVLPSKMDVKVPKTKVFGNVNVDEMRDIRCFNFDTSKAPDGTQMIPLVQREVNGQTITPAAAYKFPSGGIFISIASNDGPCISEPFQAAQLVKNYLFLLSRGIPKVFNYNFRSHGEVSVYEGAFGIIRKDMSEKPAFHAYQTLTKLIGNHPKITYACKDGISRADWISPDGSPVCAIWALDGKSISAEITLEGASYKILKIGGKTAKKGDIDGGTKTIKRKIGIFPFYTLGAKVKSITPIKQK